MEPVPDTELVGRCRQGDEEAWRLLVERYGPLILSIPRRYGLRAAQAEDVHAEVCLALVRSLGGLRDPKALPKWLIRTATRATWEALRKAPDAVPLEDLPPLGPGTPPDALVSLLEEEQEVHHALDHVSERCRRLLHLLYFADPTPSYDEVSAKLGVPRGSLGPTRRRCLDKLRDHLSPRLGGEDVSQAPGRAPKGVTGR
ncbi:MAG: RNA polymerase sigma factor [Planctomycetota bacterium]